MRKIKFVQHLSRQNNAEEGPKEYLFESVRFINDKSDLHKVCIDVMKEAVENGVEDFATKVYLERYDSASSIPPSIGYTNDEKEGIQFSKLRLLENGEIYFFERYAYLDYSWTLKEFQELFDNGYIKGNKEEIHFVVPEGRGSLGISFLPLIEQLSIVIEVGNFGIKSYIFVKNKIIRFLQNRKIRKIAIHWERENGIHHIAQLREFISLKGSWKLNEVEKRLKLSQEYATKLLDALGLECHKDIWVPSYSEDAIKKRKRWEETEFKRRIDK